MTGRVLLVAGGVLLLAAVIVLSAWVWMSTGPVAMSVHGWIALSLGVVLTLGLAVGLMALLFHSSRSGHDENVTQDDEYL